MTNQIEHMLLNNNSEMHGMIKTMYSQWYKAQIVQITIGIVIVIALVCVFAVLVKKLNSEHKRLAKLEKDNEYGDKFQNQTFIEWAFDQHFTTAMVSTAILAITIGLIIAIACQITDLTIQPQVEFVKDLLTNND